MHKSETQKFNEAEAKEAHQLDGTFRRDYQRWYTEASAVIRQIIPDRKIEFEYLYKGDGKRRKIDASNYNIQDWLGGLNFTSGDVNGFAGAAMRFVMQFDILKAAERRFESS